MKINLRAPDGIAMVLPAPGYFIDLVLSRSVLRQGELTFPNRRTQDSIELYMIELCLVEVRKRDLLFAFG